MVEVVSLVNFDNPARVDYLERSFGTFYKHEYDVRHLVFDSSQSIDLQNQIYKRFNCEIHHCPGAYYGERLKQAMECLKGDFFLFLPDDFHWIFQYPLEEAISECRERGVAELKLSCRGMRWFSKPNPDPEPWFQGAKVMSGENLVQEGNLFISKRRWIRDFHEQFSLACNVLNTEFAKWVIDRIPSTVVSPGAAEKRAYIRLVLKRYFTAYYRMWIPAFHFIDLDVEGDNDKNRNKAETSLVENNFEIYNRLYNS